MIKCDCSGFNMVPDEQKQFYYACKKKSFLIWFCTTSITWQLVCSLASHPSMSILIHPSTKTLCLLPWFWSVCRGLTYNCTNLLKLYHIFNANPFSIMTEESISHPLIWQASAGMKDVDMIAEFESPVLSWSSCLAKESKEDVSMHPAGLHCFARVL